jgi:hypothetical protein
MVGAARVEAEFLNEKGDLDRLFTRAVAYHTDLSAAAGAMAGFVASVVW